jgi:hypothetical protein
MYDFLPRVPFDHALALVRNIRSGDFDRGDNLLLAGAITGEIGALLKSGLTISLSAEDTPATLDGCCMAFESAAGVAESEPYFDPGIWVPIIIKLIELWLSNRK